MKRKEPNLLASAKISQRPASIDAVAPSLTQLRASTASLGVMLGCKRIEPADEFELFPEELRSFAAGVASVRRQSGAARGAARSLFPYFGIAACAIPKGRSGAPIWPAGIVGSLAHDADVAVAALARDRGGSSLGVDVEPDEGLSPDVVNLVATPCERRRYHDAILRSRLLFAIKEAVYKATFPIDGDFLDFQDVEVDLDLGVATTRRGREVRFFVARDVRILALAVIGL